MEKNFPFEKKLSVDALTVQGIAHDYNNIACIILGNISLAKKYIESDHYIYNLLNDAEQGAMQAKELSKFLLDNINEPILGKKAVCLSKIIHEYAQFLLQKNQINVVYESPEEELIIEGFEIEIKQIIRNIILNAKQSVADAGTIMISASEIYLPEANQYLLSCGKYVKLTFANDTDEIPIKNIDRMFDTHFSTKKNAHGLGLAICRAIVKRHRGHIGVSYENEKNIKFEIFLPMFGK